MGTKRILSSRQLRASRRSGLRRSSGSANITLACRRNTSSADLGPFRNPSAPRESSPLSYDLRKEYADYVRDELADANTFFTLTVRAPWSIDLWHIKVARYVDKFRLRFKGHGRWFFTFEPHADGTIHAHGIAVLPPKTMTAKLGLTRRMVEQSIKDHRMDRHTADLFRHYAFMPAASRLWSMHYWTYLTGGRARFEDIEKRVGNVAQYCAKYILKDRSDVSDEYVTDYMWDALARFEA